MSSLIPQNAWKGKRYHDPWFKAEQWRYEHPMVATKYIWKNFLPGFGYASVAFATYCTVEYFVNQFKNRSHQQPKPTSSSPH